MANYCTVDEIKTQLELTTDDYDDMFSFWIGTASAFIDNYCNRHFDQRSSTTRYFDGAGTVLWIDDLLSVTTFKLDEDGDGTYEETLETSDYILYPLNETPKTRVEISNDSDYGSFAAGVKKGVSITGTWGYASSVPSIIRQATVIQVCRWHKRKDTGYGTVIGTPEVGGEFTVYHGLDPDIKMLIKPLKRRNS